MPRILKHFAAIVVLLVVAGCAGGGGCSSCGMTPLPSGFKAEDRIENAGSFRVTQSGMDFIEQNLGTLAQTLLGSGNGGIITFPVPESSGSALVDYTVCPGGADPNATPPKCTAEINLGTAALQIDPSNPHNLHVHGPLPIRLQNLPIEIDYGILGTDTAVATLNGNNVCPPGNQTFANIDVDVDISIEIDTNQAHSRHGYSRIKIGAVNINQNQITSSLHLNCGSSVTGTILNFLKGIVVPLLIDPLISTLQDQLDSQLCQQANPELSPPCPDGTNDVDGVCRYGTQPGDECASILLGLDGHMDLGSLLSSISPGTTGGLDLLFAGGGESQRDDGSGFAWGDLNPVGGGMTLGLYGGAEPKPVSKCVPFANIPLPAGIPIPDELVQNTVDNWPASLPGPHVGIAVSERFANYALTGMYNSGLLCLGISTETVPLLNSGTLGLLATSSKDLTIQREPQQIAIVVRPNAPPKLTFGNGTDIASDPLIRVQLDKASFDFYVWSLDRFIRFMTATFDLDVPLNLDVTPEGLTPVLDKIGVNNGQVTNNDLLREDPAAIAASLADLLAGQVGQAVGGGISPIDLNSALSSLGLTLTIPESVEGQGSPGLRKLSKGQDNYLGIFAAFGVASPAAPLVADTDVQLVNKDVQAAGLRLPTMTADNGPSARLVMTSTLDDGSRAVEYSYRVDQGPWHPFRQSRYVDLRDSYLRLQGRHVIAVRSRAAGNAMSLDPTPATVDFVVDVDPPAIGVGSVEDGQVTLDVRDMVSDGAHAQVRVRLDDGAWSEWAAASELRVVEVGDAADIEVEAMDEEGNVGTARQALIRGRAPVDAAGGCGCEVAGRAGGTTSAGWLVGLAMAAVALRLGRRGRAGADKAREAAPRRAPLARRAGHGAAGLAVIALAGSYSGCSCGDDPTFNSAQCADCVTLSYGLIGAYTSTAVSGKDVWVAGYAEADWNNGLQYGDLVVGKWDGQAIDWVAVDGVPDEPAVDPKKFNTKGFRGGQTDPGEDVGLWTSIAVGPDGEPAVAYYDRTNRALRFAQRRGDAWSVQTVQSGVTSDFGRYAKLLFVGGVPVIAYQAVQPGDAGAITSSVRLAKGSSATPAEGEWTFEDVASDAATPCRDYLCSGGTVCVVSTGLCTDPASDCASACGTDEACVAEGGTSSCAAVYGSGRLDTYPDAIGDYIAMAPDGAGGVGIAYYDRIHGNVVIASKQGAAWTTLVVDGEAADGTDTGDVGMGASLFIDGAGDWHLAYADGYSEGLRYAQVKGGTSVVPFEVADDGLGIEGTPFTDGQHIVGDDAHIVVSSSGEVRVSYQDATSGKLRFAVGTPSGTGHTWLVRELSQEGFAGAFSQIIEIDGKVQVGGWWRVGGQDVHGDVSFVSP